MGQSYIGAVVSVSAGNPATFDAAGYAAKSWTALNNVETWPEMGDTSADLTTTLLSGRTDHTNGALDGGSGDFSVIVPTGAADAGLTILRTNANTNNPVSFRVADPDGTIAYSAGVVASLRDRAREAGNIKGVTGQVRFNAAVVRA